MVPKPSWFDWLTVAAIVLGPVLALLPQRYLDRIRQRKDQRLRLYFALMASRARLSYVVTSPAWVLPSVR